MTQTTYLNLPEARAALAEIGVVLTDRQMKRAAETDLHGRRKLPFFIDPIEKRLKIEKTLLLGIYKNLQEEAEIKAVFNKKSCLDHFIC